MIWQYLMLVAMVVIILTRIWMLSNELTKSLKRVIFEVAVDAGLLLVMACLLRQEGFW